MVSCQPGEGLRVQMPYLPFVEMEIVGEISAVVNAGEAGAEAKIDVREIAVLREARADADGAGIAVADFDVDVRHRGVEGAGRGVARRFVILRATAGEEDHVLRMVFVAIEAGRVRCEDEDGARGAVADEADAGPDVDGVGEAVAAGGDEDDALVVGFLDGVDGSLDGVGVVGEAVAFAFWRWSRRGR